MSTRRIVLGALVIAGACLGLAAAYAHGPWQDLWLNLLAEAVGAAFIVLFVDVLFERSKARERDARRRTALHELGSILRELQVWLAGFVTSGPAAREREHATRTDALADDLDGLVAGLGEIDFAAPGRFKRDRYFVEWARRTFDQTTTELGRWEFNFVDSAGLFGDDFREGAESLRTFVRAMAAFLEGMERYVTRESPTSPVRAYEGVTELTAETAARLVSDLQEFLRFYRDLCDRYGVVSPEFATGQ